MRIVWVESQVQRLMAFLALLAKWNQTYNLTSIRDPRDMLVVHLLDALSILPMVDAHARETVLDVGSGAGLPAIPLAIMRPLSVWSVDAVAKKISFQLQAKGTLTLTNLHPIHARIEAATIDRPVSVIVSRAFSDLSKMLRSVDRLAGNETTVIAMKGVVPSAELAEVPLAWTVREIVPLEVPFLGAERCAVVLQRSRDTTP
jgi:16S rRNA (guanine527-N7)-methyltransferase